MSRLRVERLLFVRFYEVGYCSADVGVMRVPDSGVVEMA